MLRSSELIASALQLAPSCGLPSWVGESSHCSHCAISIGEGELYSPVTLGAYFSDSRDLCNDSGIVCWRCVHLRSKVLLNGLSYTVITKHDVFPIAQNIHKAWLFMTPPAGPFVAMHSSSTMQHLAWRTPVTLDSRRISIRFGAKLFVIKPDNIRKAVEIACAVTEKNQGKWMSPLILDRKAAQENHGVMNPKAAALMSVDEISFFHQLSAGDRWALSAVMHSKLPEPTRPDPITSTLASKL